jgi:hypothetical protein
MRPRRALNAVAAVLAIVAVFAVGAAPATAAEPDDVLPVGEAIGLLSLHDLGVRPNEPVVAAVGRTTGRGGWLVARDGGVFALGDAPFLGTATAAAPVAAALAVGDGLWAVSETGKVVSVGAPVPPPSAGVRLTARLTDAALAPGGGLWLLARDGTTYALGGARPLPRVTLGIWEIAVSLAPVAGGVEVLTGGGRVAGLAGAASRRVRVALPAVDQLPDGSVVESTGRITTPSGEVRSSDRCLSQPVATAMTGGGSVWLVTSSRPPVATVGLHPLDALDAEAADVVAGLRYAQACQAVVESPAWSIVHPLPGARSSSAFGSRIHPIYGRRQLHRGLDLAGGRTSAVRAAAAGEVVEVRERVGYGITLVIDHGDRRATLYGHLSRATVAVGDVVTAGQGVGVVGRTGFATGPHLHFEVRVDGEVVDPTPYVQAAG